MNLPQSSTSCIRKCKANPELKFSKVIRDIYFEIDGNKYQVVKPIIRLKAVDEAIMKHVCFVSLKPFPWKFYVFFFL